MNTDTLVETATADGFGELLSRDDRPVVVDFGATWCAPCRRLAPVFADVALAFGARARFASVDVDAEPELAGQFGVMSIPTIKLFRAGSPVETMTGAASREQLMTTLETWLRP